METPGVLASQVMEKYDGDEKTVDGIPVSKLIGVMVGSHIAKCLVPYNDFVRKAKEVGLDEEFIPNKPRSHNAFRCAIRDMEERFYTKTKEGDEYRVHMVVDYPQNTPWHTISKRVFGRDSNLKFKNLVEQEVLFNVRVNDGDVEIIPYNDEKPYPILRDKYKDNIQAKYNMYMGNLHSDYIRRAVKKTIKMSAGIPYTVSNGGTFFVPIDELPRLRKWERIFEWIRENDFESGSEYYVGPGSRLVIKAVLNTTKERDFLMEDAEEELANKHRKWLKDLLHLVKRKDDEEGVIKTLNKKMGQKANLGKDMQKRYKQLLGEEVELKIHKDLVKEYDELRIDGKKPSPRVKGMFTKLLEE